MLHARRTAAPTYEYHMVTPAFRLYLFLLTLCSLQECPYFIAFLKEQEILMLFSCAPALFIKGYTKERKLSEIQPVL